MFALVALESSESDVSAQRTREEEMSEKVRRNGGLIITTWEV